MGSLQFQTFSQICSCQLTGLAAFTSAQEVHLDFLFESFFLTNGIFWVFHSFKHSHKNSVASSQSLQLVPLRKKCIWTFCLTAFPLPAVSYGFSTVSNILTNILLPAHKACSFHICTLVTLLWICSPKKVLTSKELLLNLNFLFESFFLTSGILWVLYNFKYSHNYSLAAHRACSFDICILASLLWVAYQRKSWQAKKFIWTYCLKASSLGQAYQR